MHMSVPLENTIQVIEKTQVTPFAYKCKVKVLYIGRNRNGTYFDEEQATKMGEKLPGSPIVGLYDENKKDFVEHTREIAYDGVEHKYKEIDLTRPYGFVAPDAPVWFQDFQDDGGQIRKYLCTECYIWNGIYPESQRIIDKGNNQSMELNEKTFSGNWAEDLNNNTRFFIVNEAVIEKLCILGEDQEPCFEGAQIKPTFSLHDEFEALKTTMYSLVEQMRLQGGLNNPMNENEKLTGQEEQTSETQYKANPQDENKPKDQQEGKEGKENTSRNENNTDENNSEEDKNNSKKKYNLDEIPEYQTLKADYATLQRNYSALEQEKNNLVAEIEPLRVFKASAEKAKKEAMIASFYMLSDEDKADVVKNMDTYSLEEIEAKLAVIGLHNKVNFGFNQEAEQQEQETPAEEQNTLQYNLQSAAQMQNEGVPAWIQAVQATEKRI